MGNNKLSKLQRGPRGLKLSPAALNKRRGVSRPRKVNSNFSINRKSPFMPEKKRKLGNVRSNRGSGYQMNPPGPNGEPMSNWKPRMYKKKRILGGRLGGGLYKRAVNSGWQQYSKRPRDVGDYPPECDACPSGCYPIGDCQCNCYT